MLLPLNGPVFGTKKKSQAPPTYYRSLKSRATEYSLFANVLATDFRNRWIAGKKRKASGEISRVIPSQSIYAEGVKVQDHER
ncbi:hypothetical protein ACS0TY_015522 [Phlomoides rotata]